MRSHTGRFLCRGFFCPSVDAKCLCMAQIVTNFCSNFPLLVRFVETSLSNATRATCSRREILRKPRVKLQQCHSALATHVFAAETAGFFQPELSFLPLMLFLQFSFSWSQTVLCEGDSPRVDREPRSVCRQGCMPIRSSAPPLSQKMLAISNPNGLQFWSASCAPCFDKVLDQVPLPACCGLMCCQTLGSVFQQNLFFSSRAAGRLPFCANARVVSEIVSRKW